MGKVSREMFNEIEANGLKTILEGMENDPLFLYEKELEKLFKSKIKNKSIDEYMEQVVKKLKLNCQAEVISNVLSLDINIFDTWYTNHMIYLLKQKELASIERKKLINIYKFYKEEFDKISDFSEVVNDD